MTFPLLPLLLNRMAPVGTDGAKPLWLVLISRLGPVGKKRACPRPNCKTVYSDSIPDVASTYNKLNTEISTQL
jgi:hypothetical protein